MLPHLTPITCFKNVLLILDIVAGPLASAFVSHMYVCHSQTCFNLHALHCCQQSEDSLSTPLLLVAPLCHGM